MARAPDDPTLLTLSALALTRADTLFSDLDLTVSRGERLGLVAANGRGKTSLLRIIAGEEEPTQGSVTTARSARIARVPQDVPEPLLPLTAQEAVLQALHPELQEMESWRAEIAVDDIGLPEEARQHPLSALSGGWQRMVLLARAGVVEPDLILLDEPTNHLDLSRIAALEAWLAALPRGTGVIAASHDRAFLDSVTSRTLFLRPEGSRSYPLPYTAARAALDEADAAEGRRFDNDMRRAAQLRRQAAKLKNIGINSGSDLLVTKTKQLTERAERMEEAARPAHREAGAGAIRLDHGAAHAKALVTLDEAEVTAPDGRLLYRTPKLWLERGDRVVLLGPNGAGKSRLMAMIEAALAGPVPGVQVAASARPGIARQDLAQIAHATAWEAVKAADMPDARARAALAGAGLPPDLQTAPLSRLSGGQRARLAMLLLRLARPTLYLLDEPTNHLDIEGQEALEGELSAEGAAALIVSHDRAFVEAVATRTWSIEGKRLVERDDPAPVLDALSRG
nr:ATP-binding cassette domain-containing protein [Pseudoroseicyclus aestuarii]